MNRQFKDSGYYLRRAAVTAKRGVVEELSPLRARIARLRGREEEPEGRVDALRRRTTAGLWRTRAAGSRAVVRGRERVRPSRSGQSEDNS